MKRYGVAADNTRVSYGYGEGKKAKEPWCVVVDKKTERDVEIKEEDIRKGERG